MIANSVTLTFLVTMGSQVGMPRKLIFYEFKL